MKMAIVARATMPSNTHSSAATSGMAIATAMAATNREEGDLRDEARGCSPRTSPSLVWAPMSDADATGSLLPHADRSRLRRPQDSVVSVRSRAAAGRARGAR